MSDMKNTVLACIDGSKFSEAVVDYGTWISRTVQKPLTLLHNIERRRVQEFDLSGSLEPDLRVKLLEELTELEAKSSKILLEQGKQMLSQAEARAQRGGAFEVARLQRHGSLTESLIEMEEEIRVLVMGIRGEDHENGPNQIGAQLERAIRNMHRPVLIVNRPYTKPPERIMLAYDASEAARKGLEMVTTSPLYQGMKCHLVHVAKDAKTGSNVLSGAVTQLKAAGLDVETAQLQGEVEDVLLQYQNQHEIDMTVMGAFGHGRMRELLFGSVTINMLCRSQVPLLLLR